LPPPSIRQSRLPRSICLSLLAQVQSSGLIAWRRFNYEATLWGHLLAVERVQPRRALRNSFPTQTFSASRLRCKHPAWNGCATAAALPSRNHNSATLAMRRCTSQQAILCASRVVSRDFFLHNCRPIFCVALHLAEMVARCSALIRRRKITPCNCVATESATILWSRSGVAFIL
jgi:hypothetical protein